MAKRSEQQGKFNRESKLLYNRLWAIAKKADGGVTGGPAMRRLKADWNAGTVGPHLAAGEVEAYAQALAADEPEEVARVRAALGDAKAAAHRSDLALLNGKAKPGTPEFKARDAARKRVAARRAKLPQ